MAEDTTSYEETAPTPDLDQLEQEHIDIPKVPVSIDDVVGTHNVPARRVVLSTDSVGDTRFEPISPPTPKRNRLVLVSISQPIYISRDGRSQGTIWPAGAAYTVTHCDGVFVKCVTPGMTTLVGSTAEMWAD